VFVWDAPPDGQAVTFHATAATGKRSSFLRYTSGVLQANNTMVRPDGVQVPTSRTAEFELQVTSTLLSVHGLFAFLAFGLLFPCAAAAARFRLSGSKAVGYCSPWLRLHTRLVVAALVASVLALVLVEAFKLHSGDAHLRSWHGTWGALAMVVASAQAFGGVARPAAEPPTAARVYWLLGHRAAAVATLVGGIVATALGLQKQIASALPLAPLFTVWVILCAACWVGAEVRALLLSRTDGGAQLTKSSFATAAHASTNDANAEIPMARMN